MTTHANIAIKTENGYTNIYVHYDGYPSNMMPALVQFTDEELLAAREIRSLTEGDKIDAFMDARAPSHTASPSKRMDYTYYRDENGAWVWNKND